MVTDEFYAFLRRELSSNEFNDNDARRYALREQIDWYEENMQNLIEQKKGKGTINQTMQKVMRPFLAMVRKCQTFNTFQAELTVTQAEKIHLETGYHVGGYTLHEHHDPLTWVATTDLRNIRESKGTQMHAQAADLHALLR